MPAGTLYIVATPIGNLGDLTARAREILCAVPMVCCEDTRVTKKLLSHIESAARTLRLDEHATAKTMHEIRSLLEKGSDVAVVSDAGTPGVSDPGAAVVAYVSAHLPEVSIVAIPGPSALAAALSVAGFAYDRVVFAGFLPVKKGRQTRIAELAQERGCIVLYESVHRIKKTLEELEIAMGDRRVVVCRELTKQFETVYRGTIAQVLPQIVEKGEFVLVLAPQ